ncbi:phosphoglycolate phosphatase [Snodgrassella sp. CFCC 13594]|uniref:phosphoglycolate phosphatase n=1 Tax=Snodgrassella sp. CFCC 13594 TaxID=1775559 RepID=UPI00083510F9|nr:phosphoglycolate phosphatase [Snodgrassella sp. CFCC 13594]
MKWNDIHAIAFDLDGTLVDSLADLCAAANHVRGLFDLPALPEPAMAQFVGDGIGRMVHRALSGSRDGEVDEAEWSKGFVAFIEYYRSHLTTHTRPYPQVETALALFKTRGLPLAVITNKNERLATELLQQLGLVNEFSLIIGGDTLPEKKPAPLPVQHAADVLGVPIHALLMVGDSVNDILAAKAAGALSCGVTWGYGDMNALSSKAETKPDIVIDHLPQIYDGLTAHGNVQIRS